MNESIRLGAREYVMFVEFLLSPVVGTVGAHKDQVHSVLCGVSKGDGLVVAALLAVDSLAPAQSWVLDDLLVHIEFVCLLVVLALVDAVVHLVSRLRLLEVPADAAVVDQPSNCALIHHLLLGVQHVVALLAEAHSFKSH